MFLGDVPAEQLWKTIIDTRETLAAIRNAHSIYDPFVVPPGLVRTSDGPAGGNTGNVLASAITAQVLGLPSADIHSVKRTNWNAAIAAMNTNIQSLQSPTGITSNVAPLIPVAGTADTSSPVITGSNAPAIGVVAQTTTPVITAASTGISPVLLLGGAAALFFVLKKGKSKRR